MPDGVPQPLPGETLFLYRVRRGWKRAAHLAFAAGVPEAFMSHLENGRVVSQKATLRLAAFLGISHESLIQLSENSRKVAP